MPLQATALDSAPFEAPSSQFQCPSINRWTLRVLPSSLLSHYDAMTSRVSKLCLVGWPATIGSTGSPPLKRTRRLPCVMRRSPARSRQHRARGSALTFAYYSGFCVRQWRSADTGLAAPTSAHERLCLKLETAALALCAGSLGLNFHGGAKSLAEAAVLPAERIVHK